MRSRARKPKRRWRILLAQMARFAARDEAAYERYFAERFGKR